MPQNCILLVDTYDTLQGVRHAVEIGRRLRKRGQELTGIRLDSGDLAALSLEARRILDAAGFEDVKIVGSGDLDEYVIADLKRRDARITVWGVGTRLATAFGEPALGGVYKLAAVRDPGGAWRRRMKRSDTPDKATLPGILQVRRRRTGDRFEEDLLYDLEAPVAGEGEDLLLPVIRSGRAVYEPPSATEARARALDQIAALPAGVRRLIDPEVYPVRWEASLEARVREAMR
jgi:nicotinate phosphoribosyltransferase